MKKLFIALLCFSAATTLAADGKKIKLIIDAAHGGNDPGFVTATGDKESEICLQFANALYDYAKTLNIDVQLTRKSNEETIPLTVRTRFATDADVKTYFISFHLNTAEDKTKRGGEILYSSDNPDAEGSIALAQKMVTYMNILNDVKTNLRDSKAIVVLKNSPTTAIAINPGYMSNDRDLMKLKDVATQKELAMMIVKAISE